MEKSHGSAVSLVVMANENPWLSNLCVLEERRQQKCPFFMTRKECFPNNRSWTHCTLYINSCSFPGKMFAVSYWATLRDPGNSAPADIQARVMRIMCFYTWWLLACQREPELAGGCLSPTRALPPPRHGRGILAAAQAPSPAPTLSITAVFLATRPITGVSSCVLRASQNRGYLRVLIRQTGNSSQDTPAFAPTQAIRSTLHPACTTSTTHLSLQWIFWI